MKIQSNSIQPTTLLQLFLTVAASLLTLRLGAGLAAWRTANRLEKPAYTVVRRLPSAPSTHRRCQVEVRKYEPYLIAETTIDESSMRKAGSLGFGRCAGYIFGKNQPRQSKTNNEEPEAMAMTAPVRTVGRQPRGEKMAMTSPVRATGNANTSGNNNGNKSKSKTKVSFVIGSKYTLKTAPKPLDSNVKIRQVPSHYLAATTFSGPPPSDERVGEERNILEQTLEREGIKILGKKGHGEGETMVYGYHDPVITPNILRKNEVAVMVDGKSVVRSQC
mmetsp:Transcript_22136/g.44984  ORF Transcript_22136/g.44984 Transcript_22136/m.44984 type:complete len:276 (-) Transcript_22136:73-900(-)